MQPHPDTPEFSQDVLEEIGNYKFDILGPGIVVFRGVVDFDQEKVFDYIDGRAEDAHRDRWSYVVGEDGEKYGVNEDGFRYRIEDIPSTPVRLLRPVDQNTPEEISSFFKEVEDTIYKCLIKYIDFYPLLLGCIWWKNRGHILRYVDQGVLGSHCDNDTNYKVTNGTRYMPRGQAAARQTCGALVYFNDCVDQDSEMGKNDFVGGHLRFFHLGVEYKPKRGDIIMFPTNYIASHNVTNMTAGKRYTYLSFFGQGSPDPNVNINIVEPENSFDWCPGVWLNNIYDDYEKFCRSEFSLYSGDQVELGINPIYQGRCVTQYGDTHDAEVIER
jgi:hypothetical protein